MAQDEDRPGLQQAAALLRAGDLAAARTAFETLLRGSPADPVLLGELSSILLRQGQEPEAQATLKRALAAGGAPRVRLLNLNRYFVLLLRRKDTGEAERMAAEGLPDWPEGVAPGPGEHTMRLSLTTALLLLGLPQQGTRLLGQAFPAPGDDVDVLLLAGRLRLALGDAEAHLPR